MIKQSMVAVLAILVVVDSQTFQYSRGWTNGKRSEGRRNGVLDLEVLERIFSNPCQMEKLKYILDGKPITEKIFQPCEFVYGTAELQDENRSNAETQNKKQYGGKTEGNGKADQLFANFLQN